VVSSRNPLVGQSIREGGFRRRYGAVVVAVARAGERLGGRVGDIVLHAGDVLLLEALPTFAAEQRVRSDFVLVSSLEGASLPRTACIPYAAGIMAALMVVVTLELLPTVTAALLAAGAMVASGCCTVEEARRSLDLTVLVAISAAFGLGRAMQVSGLDALVAEGAVSAGATSPMLALASVYVVTAVLTEVVTNNAAAVLTLPIALQLADAVGVAPMPFVITVMFAASAAFNTPIGYQTNLMVYNAGGYRPSDYPRVGLPVSFAVAAVVLLGVPWWWPF
jgi:di/tricarboxylate transporter